jgi:hypothetical protein
MHHDAARKSILDYIRDDSKALTQSVGSGDKQKLDEYFTSIREVELRMERAAHLPPVQAPEGAKEPAGIPESYAEHLRLMGDLLVLAFHFRQRSK